MKGSRISIENGDVFKSTIGVIYDVTEAGRKWVTLVSRPYGGKLPTTKESIRIAGWTKITQEATK